MKTPAGSKPPERRGLTLVRPLDLQDSRLAPGDPHQTVEDFDHAVVGRRFGKADVRRWAVREDECGSAEHAMLRDSLGVVSRQRLQDRWVVEVAAKALEVEPGFGGQPLDDASVVDVRAVAVPGEEESF